MDEIKPGQSLELLKHLHILTRDGKMNQDSRRKLKQVYHLYNFIEPLLKKITETGDSSKLNLVDHGAGKSYLGFILYDLFFKGRKEGHVFGIETREPLIKASVELANKLEFTRMSFLNLSVADSVASKEIPDQVGIVTALHACDTATDDAIQFALKKQARFLVLVPCCQAEVAGLLRKNKSKSLSNPLVELYREPLHTREFGSHLTNVLRCLWLESKGYDLTVTELVGWEHSMKNELIIAKKTEDLHSATKSRKANERLQTLVREFKLEEISERYQ